ncbi:lysosomal alpha-glucosidase [Trichonephila inaurata madagascariensis]|uniref:Lysosomal alpha-glucosidase n=1 Tax=Trichonephila inaurata madagascariensis TaxID=2747483 RepID=A0A8X6XDG1_9ARAC|nr:lysosomal alpha-glucosidase [Trichonephila inaurata madagascariensis]
MKKESFGFKIEEVSESRDGMEVRLSNLSANTPYGPSFTSVNVSVIYITADIVRVRFLDNQNQRFQVPVQNEFPLLQNREEVDLTSLTYEVLILNKSDIFSFQIKRLEDQTILKAYNRLKNLVAQVARKSSPAQPSNTSRSHLNEQKEEKGWQRPNRNTEKPFTILELHKSKKCPPLNFASPWQTPGPCA